MSDRHCGIEVVVEVGDDGGALVAGLEADEVVAELVATEEVGEMLGLCDELFEPDPGVELSHPASATPAKIITMISCERR